MAQPRSPFASKTLSLASVNLTTTEVLVVEGDKATPQVFWITEKRDHAYVNIDRYYK